MVSNHYGIESAGWVGGCDNGGEGWSRVPGHSYGLTNDSQPDQLLMIS